MRIKKSVPLDQFTPTEMSLAVGVIPRNFMLLIERGRWLKPTVTGPGKTSTRYWDVAGLSEAAILGGLHKGGVPLFAAATLARNFVEAEVDPRARFPSRLQDDLDLGELPSDFGTNDFWVHRYRRGTNTYEPRRARDGDILLEIVDREYVCTDSPRLPGSKDRVVAALCRITNWSRDDVSIRPAWDELGVAVDDSSAIKALDAEYARARDNAISILRVNVSLAIRSALDNVHDHRAARGS